jgi:hypothetical protein
MRGALPLLWMLILLVVLTVGGCGEEATRPPDPHAFGREIVAALKTEDGDRFQQLIYTREDVEYMLEHRPAAGRDLEAYREGWLDGYERKRDEIERSFARMHREASAQGLEDWSDVTFKTVDFKTVREGDFTRYEIVVELSDDGRLEYVVSEATAWKTPTGLALQSPPTLLTRERRQGLGR